MKYIKLYEMIEKDIDPFEEEDWDEVDDINKCYVLDKLNGVVRIRVGTLSEEDELGGKHIIGKDGESITYPKIKNLPSGSSIYIRHNLEKLNDRGYIILKKRITETGDFPKGKPQIFITTSKAMVRMFKEHMKNSEEWK